MVQVRVRPAKRAKREPKFRPTFLRAWREYRGLTQEQLVARLDALNVETTEATISRLENGQMKYQQEMLEALAAALDCTADDIIGRDPQTNDYKVWALIRTLPSDDRERAVRLIEALVGKAA